MCSSDLMVSWEGADMFTSDYTSGTASKSLTPGYSPAAAPVDPPANVFARCAAFLENFILPVYFLFDAYRLLISPDGVDIFNKSTFWTSKWYVQGELETASSILLFIVQFSIGVTLIINRRPAVRYRNLREVFVPLAVVFFVIPYDHINLLHDYWKVPLIDPYDPRMPLVGIIGATLGAVGMAISVWGIWTLGRSFGVLVAVRTVKVRGPYRFVRHPIYLGYLMGFVGLLMMQPAPIYFVLFPCTYILMKWRSRLEENKVASVSPQYKELMTRTGFFLPRMPWSR